MAKKILVVDDEFALVDMLKMRLEANSYEVITALDGKTGLERATADAPDLIILDIMMPELDGYEVLRELKKNEKTRSIPVLMLTAKGDTSAIMESQELQATDHLIKPFDPDELLRLIDRYL